MEKTGSNSKIVSFEEFSKMDLRIGKIIKAECIPSSKNLVKLSIDVGEGEIRQAVAGLVQYYSPSDLDGKHVAVIVNLQTKRMFGFESNVMILAAEDEKTVSMLLPDRPVKVGSKIR
jgi:methionyl-tRNA synthetase